MSTRPPTRETITARRLSYGERAGELARTSPGGAWAAAALALAEDAVSEELAARNERLLDSAEAIECRRALEAIAADPSAGPALRAAATEAIDRARRA